MTAVIVDRWQVLLVAKDHFVARGHFPDRGRPTGFIPNDQQVGAGW
jgi:hypothetical protein